uniref:Uncharacterized protein n=1 Tax=Arundo donax TaxID=35708 RepID=A0A0A9CYP8_ARUDO
MCYLPLLLVPYCSLLLIRPLMLMFVQYSLSVHNNFIMKVCVSYLQILGMISCCISEGKETQIRNRSKDFVE